MNVKEFFEEELSGEPLTQSAVEEGLILFGIQLLEKHIEHPNKPGYRRSDVLNSIKELKSEHQKRLKKD